MTALVDVEELPLPDSSVDRMIVVHCLEHAERVPPLLEEIWRVLAAEGRVLFIVPNRGGVWARIESTPFGQGRPYSRGQLERLLHDATLRPIDCAWALHVPPLERELILRSAVAFERMGARVWPGVAGVMMLEARKELTRPVSSGTPAIALGEIIRLPSPKPAGPVRGRSGNRTTVRDSD